MLLVLTKALLHYSIALGTQLLIFLRHFEGDGAWAEPRKLKFSYSQGLHSLSDDVPVNSLLNYSTDAHPIVAL